MNIEMFNQAIDSIATKLEVPTKYILEMFMKSGKFDVIETFIFFNWLYSSCLFIF